MKLNYTILFGAALLANCIACDVEDPGPLQKSVEEYSVLDFDQLEIGSGLNIRVEESNTFLVKAEGDSRNLNDLEVLKAGTTLVIRFDEDSERRHQTYITIEMPAIRGVNFSGASVSVIRGFESDGTLDLVLSGGSICQLDAGYRQLKANVSGASLLKLHGLGDEFSADISGASSVSAFDYPVRDGNFVLSGASTLSTTVSDLLKVNATGGSMITFRGNPHVDQTLSGGSTVNQD